MDFVVRKMYLGYAASLGIPSWLCPQGLNLKHVRDVSADAKEHLRALPETWTAGETSLFLTQRQDWSIFASMFMCLWTEVADKAKDQEAVAHWILKNCAALTAAAKKYKDEHGGVTPHPWVLMGAAGAPVGDGIGSRKRKAGA